MARTDDIISAIASVTGKRVADVALTVRRLREQEYWVRETRSPRSPRPTPEHVSFLLVALLSGATAKDAPEAVVETVGTQCSIIDESMMDKLLMLAAKGIFRKTVEVLKEKANCIHDLLQALLLDIMAQPLAFDDSDVEIRVQFDQVYFGAFFTFMFSLDGEKKEFTVNYVNIPVFEGKGELDYHQLGEFSKRTLIAAARALGIRDD